jgi:hypothetical protein
MKLQGIISANFDVRYEQRTRGSTFVRNWKCNGTVHQLYIDFKKACDSVRRQVLCSIFNEFSVPVKLIMSIKMRLNETCSKLRISKNLSDAFLIQNGLKGGNAFSPLLFNFALEYTMRMVQESSRLDLNGTH